MASSMRNSEAYTSCLFFLTKKQVPVTLCFSTIAELKVNFVELLTYKKVAQNKKYT